GAEINEALKCAPSLGRRARQLLVEKGLLERQGRRGGELYRASGVGGVNDGTSSARASGVEVASVASTSEVAVKQTTYETAQNALCSTVRSSSYVVDHKD